MTAHWQVRSLLLGTMLAAGAGGSVLLWVFYVTKIPCWENNASELHLHVIRERNAHDNSTMSKIIL